MLKEYYEVDPLTGVPIEKYVYDESEVPEGLVPGWAGSLHHPVFDFQSNSWIEHQPESALVEKNEIWKQLEIEEMIAYLNETDFYYIRQMDNGKSIPADVKQKRDEIRKRLVELGL
jgi:hypothetical protein